MSIEACQMTVGDLHVDVVRKPIKNLHLGVYPPNGRVRVAAPLAVSDDAVRLAVVTRMGWIKRQQAKFNGQARQSARSYISGESHYFFGQRYRLNLVECGQGGGVVVRNSHTLDLYMRPGSNQTTRERVVLRWYRVELRALATLLVEKWAAKLHLPIPELGIKRMKTKWGTCSIEARRIWLNLELAKKSPQCVEYVVIHELTHFFERAHSDNFVSRMDEALPQWRTARDELNVAPLADEVWNL